MVEGETLNLELPHNLVGGAIVVMSAVDVDIDVDDDDDSDNNDDNVIDDGNDRNRVDIAKGLWEAFFAFHQPEMDISLGRVDKLSLVIIIIELCVCVCAHPQAQRI